MDGPNTYMVSHGEPHNTWQRHKIPSGRVRRIHVTGRSDGSGSGTSAILDISFVSKSLNNSIQLTVELLHRGSPAWVDIRSNGNMYTFMPAGPHMLADITLVYDGDV